MTLVSIPGNPDAIDGHVSEMASVAQAMKNAATQLRTLHDGHTFKSQAVSKIDSNANKVAVELDDSAARYHTTAGALSTYSRVLRSAQEAARSAQAGSDGLDIAQSQAHVKTLKQQVKDAMANAATLPADLTHLQHQLLLAKQHLSDQQSQAAHYLQAATNAKHDVDSAAQTAINQIHAAKQASKLNNNPGTWLSHQYSHVKKFYADHIHVYVEILKDALNELSTILAIAAVVFAVLPIPGAAIVAGVLGVAAAAVFATTVALDLIDFAMGSSISDLIIDAISIVAAKVGGKLFTKFVSKSWNALKKGPLKKAYSWESHHVGGQTRKFNKLVRGEGDNPKSYFGWRPPKASFQNYLKHKVENEVEHAKQGVEHTIEDATKHLLHHQPPAFHKPQISVPHQVPRVHVTAQGVVGAGKAIGGEVNDLYN